MTKRLIDADALEQQFNEERRLFAEQDMKGAEHVLVHSALRLLREAPTIDAVPVVRCKDCRWFGKIGCAIEVVDETDMPKENDFCSFAERKDDVTD